MGQVLLTEIQKGVKSALIKRRIISHFIYAGCTTITELSKAVGLSVPTVTKFVDVMLKDGYVNDYGKLETNGGRHPSLYGLNADSGYFVGVAVSINSLKICLINFKGDVLKMTSDIPFSLENTPECLEGICREARSFIDGLDIDREKILNVCMGITGRVNPETGCSYTHLTFTEKPLAEVLTERLGINVCIDNDSRAMAYGEYIMRNDKCAKNLIFINVNWGLGMAIIIDGKLYSGMSGFAGEFGHNYGYDNQQICDCGKKGCIETEVSIDEITLDDIISAVKREDVLAIEIVEEIGAKLGRHIGEMMNIFNPEQVIVGGEFSRVGVYLLPPVIASVRRYTLNLMYRDSDISISELKENANAIGSALLARSKFFALD